MKILHTTRTIPYWLPHLTGDISISSACQAHASFFIASKRRTQLIALAYPYIPINKWGRNMTWFRPGSSSSIAPYSPLPTWVTPSDQETASIPPLSLISLLSSLYGQVFNMAVLPEPDDPTGPGTGRSTKQQAQDDLVMAVRLTWLERNTILQGPCHLI